MWDSEVGAILGDHAIYFGISLELDEEAYGSLSL